MVIFLFMHSTAASFIKTIFLLDFGSEGSVVKIFNLEGKTFSLFQRITVSKTFRCPDLQLEIALTFTARIFLLSKYFEMWGSSTLMKQSDRGPGSP